MKQPMFTAKVKDGSKSKSTLIHLAGDKVNDFIQKDKRVYSICNSKGVEIFKKIFKG